MPLKTQLQASQHVPQPEVRHITFSIERTFPTTNLSQMNTMRKNLASEVRCWNRHDRSDGFLDLAAEPDAQVCLAGEVRASTSRCKPRESQVPE